MPSVKSPPPPPAPAIEIHQVWAHNLEAAFALIRSVVDQLPYASMDTEFPGVIHRSHKHPSLLTAGERYAILKANVDCLHPIQVGLALAASPSSPPSLAFEFNLRGFDPRVHRHAPDSIRLLESHGLDFSALPSRGADPRLFAALLMSSGLVCAASSVTWVTFHSAYDFGYLIKLLIGRKLPAKLRDFLNLVDVFFGGRVYDLKSMMRHCDGLFGGLERVAATLKVERAAGRSHQAGSDSLLTWEAFRRMKEVYFCKQGIEKYAGVLFGLEDDGSVVVSNGGGNQKEMDKVKKMGVLAY